MARITLVLCDVNPCNRSAEREFLVNGETIYVCGENCFLKFWSREFGNWKKSRYGLEASFHTLPAGKIELGPEEKSGNLPGIDLINTALRVVKSS